MVTILSGKARNETTVSGVPQNPEARVFRGQSPEPQASKPAGYFRCHKQVCIYSYLKELGKSCTADLLHCHNAPPPKKRKKKETAKQMMCESRKLLSITSISSLPVQCVPKNPF